MVSSILNIFLLIKSLFPFFSYISSIFCSYWFFQNAIKTGSNVILEKIFISGKTILSNVLEAWERLLRSKKIILFFPEMRVIGRKFTRATANRFSGDIFFSSLYSFDFFDACFLLLLLFVCCFLNLKMYILIHIRLYGRVSNKKTFTRPISRNKTFFWPSFFFHLLSLTQQSLQQI